MTPDHRWRQESRACRKYVPTSSPWLTDGSSPSHHRIRGRDLDSPYLSSACNARPSMAIRAVSVSRARTDAVPFCYRRELDLLIRILSVIASLGVWSDTFRAAEYSMSRSRRRGLEGDRTHLRTACFDGRGRVQHLRGRMDRCG